MEAKAQALLEKLEQEIKETWDLDPEDFEAPEGWEAYPLTGVCFCERDGCVNESSPFWNEDILSSIITMLYTLHKPIRDMVCDEVTLHEYEFVKIVVEPSYEDTSFIVIYQQKAMKVLYETSQKAWHYDYESPADLAEELHGIYETMMHNLNN